jgi:hypothetical protein
MITNMIMRGASKANARGPHGRSRFDASPRSRATQDHASRTYFNEPPARPHACEGHPPSPQARERTQPPASRAVESTNSCPPACHLMRELSVSEVKDPSVRASHRPHGPPRTTTKSGKPCARTPSKLDANDPHPSSLEVSARCGDLDCAPRMHPLMIDPWKSSRSGSGPPGRSSRAAAMGRPGATPCRWRSSCRRSHRRWSTTSA